jgi:hypothetical protein
VHVSFAQLAFKEILKAIWLDIFNKNLKIIDFKKNQDN